MRAGLGFDDGVAVEFMGRCSELRSLVGRQLQVADRAVEQGDVRVCVYPSGEFGEVGNVEASAAEPVPSEDAPGCRSAQRGCSRRRADPR